MLGTNPAKTATLADDLKALQIAFAFHDGLAAFRATFGDSHPFAEGQHQKVIRQREMLKHLLNRPSSHRWFETSAVVGTLEPVSYLLEGADKRLTDECDCRS